MPKNDKPNKADRQLIFIDDSGDPGFKATSSSNFVMAAAVFVRADAAEKITWEFDEYRKSLGWRKNTEFKFSKDRKEIITELLSIVCKHDFDVYVVYIDKTRFGSMMDIIDGNKLYDWTIAELLKTIPLSDAKIKIDGRSGKQKMMRTAAYLRREVNNDDKKKLEIKFEDSKSDNLIQLADLIAGSINRSLSHDKTDALRYVGIFKDKIKSFREIAR